MKNFFKQNYHLHLLGGALIGWVLSMTFEGVPIVIQYFITIFVSGITATGWEWFWKIKNNSPIDYRDVFWGVVGAVVTLTIFIL
jgi:hypothetical protein